VDVGVADAAIENVDQRLVGAGLAALDAEGGKRRFGVSGGIGRGLEGARDSTTASMTLPLSVRGVDLCI
jgi:hypothetical protein